MDAGGVMLDYVIRLALIWLPVSVFWRTMEETVVTVVKNAGGLPRGMLMSVYLTVFVLMTGVRYILEEITARSDRTIVKLPSEFLYVGISAVASTVLWIGKDIVS